MRRVLLVLCLFASAPAQATETRVQALQGQAGVQDETDIFRYPALATSYNLALAELGTAANTNVYGAAIGGNGAFAGAIAVSRSDWLLDGGVLGTDRSLFERYEGALSSTANNGPFLVGAKRPIELIGAMKLGKAGPAIGLRIALATHRRREETGEGATKRTVKQLAEQVDVTLGISGPAGGGNYDAGVTTHALARQERAESAPGVSSGASVKKKSGGQLSGRYIFDRDGFGPYVEGTFMKRGFTANVKNAAGTKSSDFLEQLIAVEGGWAAQFTQREAKGYGGLILAQTNSRGPTVTGQGGSVAPSFLTRDDASASIKSTILSASLAGEGLISGGFGARAGLRYALYGTTVETDKTSGSLRKVETTIDETPDGSFWTLGAYYKEGPLVFDALYSKAFLHNGPYFVSGSATSPLFGRLSASYAF